MAVNIDIILSGVRKNRIYKRLNILIKILNYINTIPRIYKKGWSPTTFSGYISRKKKKNQERIKIRNVSQYAQPNR